MGHDIHPPDKHAAEEVSPWKQEEEGRPRNRKPVSDNIHTRNPYRNNGPSIMDGVDRPGNWSHPFHHIQKVMLPIQKEMPKLRQKAQVR